MEQLREVPRARLGRTMGSVVHDEGAEFWRLQQIATGGGLRRCGAAHLPVACGGAKVQGEAAGGARPGQGSAAAGRIAGLLSALSADARRQVIARGMSAAQRRALEAFLLAGARPRPPGAQARCARPEADAEGAGQHMGQASQHAPAAAAPFGMAQPVEEVSLASPTQLARHTAPRIVALDGQGDAPPWLKRRAGEAARSAKRAQRRWQPLARTAVAAPAASVTETAASGAVSSPSAIGIFRRASGPAAGTIKYRAALSLVGLRIQAPPRHSRAKALEDRMDLLKFRRRVVNGGSAPFDERVRCAVNAGVFAAAPPCGRTLEDFGWVFNVAVSGLYRRVMLSPTYGPGQLEAALSAWRRLRAARIGSLQSDRDRRSTPTEMVESWESTKVVLQDLWCVAGAVPSRTMQRLKNAETSSEARAQREWERWNRRRMREEERLIRKHIRDQRRELRCMAAEDAASRKERACRRSRRTEELNTIRHLKALLAKWTAGGCLARVTQGNTTMNINTDESDLEACSRP